MRTIFFHIGFCKTGTTYLQKIVFPEIENLTYLNSENKEIEEIFYNLLYINDEKFNKRKKLCKTLFEKLLNKHQNNILLSNENFSCALTNFNNNYLLAIKRFKKIVPKKYKIIFILVTRNQINLIQSLISEHQVLISKYYEINKLLNLDYIDDSNIFFFNLKFYVLKENIKNIFEKEKIYLLSYEDLHDRPKFFFDKLSIILNLKKNIKFKNIKLNQSPMTQNNYLVKKYDLIKKIKKNLLKHFKFNNLEYLFSIKFIIAILKNYISRNKKIVLNDKMISILKKYYRI